MLLAVALASGPRWAEAQDRGAVRPMGGPWCGLALVEGQIGQVYLEVTPDGRFIDRLRVRTPESFTLDTREQRNTDRVSVREGRFSYRGDRQPRCSGPGCPDPCAGRPNCFPVYDVLNFSGRVFLAHEIGGQFSATVHHTDRRGRPPRAEKLAGRFVAWPRHLAPCW